MNHTNANSLMGEACRRYRFRMGKTVSYCPQCHRRTFKPFLDASGVILDPTVGRCNRQFKCGYFLSPRQFFEANPSRRPTIGRLLPPMPPPPPVDFMPRQLVERSQKLFADDDSLKRFFLTLFPRPTVDAVWRLYCVGQSKLSGRSTMFWIIDDKMRVRTGKAMAYGPDGHRIRNPSAGNPVCYVHKLYRRSFNCSLCYFGSHLTQLFPSAELLMVESEKTALFLACCLGHKMLHGRLPIAVGGCSNLTYDPAAHRLAPDTYRGAMLHGRRLRLIPDCDAFSKWVSAASGLSQTAARVAILDLRSYAAAPTDDIMDIMLRRHPVGSKTGKHL